MPASRLASALAALLVLAACGGSPKENAIHPSPAPAAPAPGASSPAPASAPPGGELAPLSSRGTPVASTAAQPSASMASASAASAVGLALTLPAAWQEQTPGSSMRFVQAVVPGSAGAGEMAGFYFGPGQGGGLEANIERWLGQIGVTQPSHRESFEAGGLRVTWIEAKGTLLPSGMGMGPTTPQPNSTLLGAVIEGPDGPWFIKVTGPEATLGAARGDFLAMLKGVRAGG